MQELDVTTARLFKIYWLFVWRGAVGGLLIGAIFGFVVGLLMGIAGATKEHVVVVTASLGWVVGLIWSFCVLRMAIKKRYKDFRIVLVGIDPTPG